MLSLQPDLLYEPWIRGGIWAFAANEVQRLFKPPAVSEHHVGSEARNAPSRAVHRVH